MFSRSNIVIGYHGCDKSVADKVLNQGLELDESTNSYDWLGNGIYFWEGSYSRALEWAENSSKVNIPAVIGAFINMGNCLDLLDKFHLSKVKTAYDILKLEFKTENKTLPTNKALKDGIFFSRDLDCKVISHLHILNESDIASELEVPFDSTEIKKHYDYIDTVRGMFPEGKELYENAGFRDSNHIQIAVRNPNSIIGYFRPKEQNDSYKKLY